MLITTCPACEQGTHEACHGCRPAPPGVFGGSKCDCQVCEDRLHRRRAKDVVETSRVSIDDCGVVRPLTYKGALVSEMVAFPISIAAKLCGLSESTLYEDIKAGLLKKTSRGIVTRRELERYLNASLVKESV